MHLRRSGTFVPGAYDVGDVPNVSLSEDSSRFRFAISMTVKFKQFTAFPGNLSIDHVAFDY